MINICESDIILPAYNGSVYIKSQITSILDQSIRNWVLKISDDCSTDDTDHTLRYMAVDFSKIELAFQAHNIGIIENINYLLKTSSSYYTFFSDQDDVWLHHKIEISLKK